MEIFITYPIPGSILAYLDPGTGSMIIQLLIATVCGGLFAIKLFWHKIKEFFTKIFSKNKNAKN